MNKPDAASKGFHVVRGGADGVDGGPLAGAVVAIGNFDGVHRGHRAVIGAALKRARKLKRKVAALASALPGLGRKRLIAYYKASK